MEITELTYKVKGAIFNVYKELGPGLLENIYEEALVYELRLQGIITQTQLQIPVIYKGVQLGYPLRLDVIVEDTLVIEIKSVKELEKVHFKQLYTYLKLANKPLGVLVNFNTDNIIHSVHILNPRPYTDESNQ